MWCTVVFNERVPLLVWTIKTHHFQHRKIWEQDTYIFNIKGSRCYYYHHHHCHNHQLTAVCFVGTVATVVYAVTHISAADTFLVCALPFAHGALPVDWTTNKVIAFSVTCKHLHRHCIRLSSFSYTFVFTAFVFLIIFIHQPFSSRSLTLTVLFTYIVSCIQHYRHIRSPPSALHSWTLSLLLVFSYVHFYCHLHSHWTCPCGACTGMVKARTGTGLLTLFLYRPCMGMVRVSLLSRVCFCFSGVNIWWEATLIVMTSHWTFCRLCIFSNTLLPDCFWIWRTHRTFTVRTQFLFEVNNRG